MDAVGGEILVERRDALASGLLGVEAVDQCLVSLPAVDEPNRLLLRPGPDPVGRIGSVQGRYEGGRLGVEPAQHGVIAVGAWGILVDSVGRGGPARDDRAPEMLDPREVPEQVGGVPVRAPGHVCLGIAVGEHVAKAARLGDDVVAVGLEVQSGHGATLDVSSERRHPLDPGIQRPV